jgi:hypothetical protein
MVMCSRDAASGRQETYSFFDLAKLLKLGAESDIVGVPGKAASSDISDRVLREERSTYPMKSLDMMADG